MARQFKVIVADDEKLIAKNIARRIEESSEAFRVIARAGSGTEALEQARELLPDVVFSDIKMPEMDGIELIAALRKEHPSVLCVIVSGYSDFEYMKAAIQNSAVDYLLKPVNPEELKHLLQRLEATLLAREQQVVPRREADAAALAENVRVYLQENYDKPVDFSALADSLAVSAPYLSKLFHEQTGSSPSKYLTDMELKVSDLAGALHSFWRSQRCVPRGKVRSSRFFIFRQLKRSFSNISIFYLCKFGRLLYVFLK